MAINFSDQDLSGVYVYLDDIAVISDSWEDHLARLYRLFFCASESRLLHQTSQVEVWVRTKQPNVEAILSFPILTARKSEDILGYGRVLPAILQELRDNLYSFY